MMGDINEILGLERPLFCHSHLESVTLPVFPLQDYKNQIDKYQALHSQNKFQNESVTKLEKEIESMKNLLQECKQLKLNVTEKQEYYQTFLHRLNKSLLMKEGELLNKKSKNRCSEKDKALICKQKQLVLLLEQLLGVKICTKYSDGETITLKAKKNDLTKPHTSQDKENYFQIKNNSTEAWQLLEKLNKQGIRELCALRNGHK
ncbi:hypothetical protein M8J76_014169 [Diaphorina citri]|nr:hypothetical protein M8J76_014169 [Diaphorina citri]